MTAGAGDDGGGCSRIAIVTGNSYRIDAGHKVSIVKAEHQTDQRRIVGFGRFKQKRNRLIGADYTEITVKTGRVAK